MVALVVEMLADYGLAMSVDKTDTADFRGGLAGIGDTDTIPRVHVRWAKDFDPAIIIGRISRQNAPGHPCQDDRRESEKNNAVRSVPA